jgi:hypothetical protein
MEATVVGKTLMIEDESALSQGTSKRQRSSVRTDELPPTRLDAFMRARDIRLVALERASGVTRPHLRRVRLGKADPGLRVIAAITRGCRQLTNIPSLTAVDLFELE